MTNVTIVALTSVPVPTAMLNIWKQAWSKSELEPDSQHSSLGLEEHDNPLAGSTPAHSADHAPNSADGQSRKRTAKNIPNPHTSDSASRETKRRKLFNDDLSNPQDHTIANAIHTLEGGVRELEAPDDMPPLQMSSVERVAVYDPTPHAEETALLKCLLGIDKDQQVYTGLFRRAVRVLQELGPCASDLVWRDVPRDTKNNPQNDQVEDNAAIELQVKDLIVNWTFYMPNTDSASKGFNVSPKLAKLIELLSAYRVTKDSFKGIVYVKNRSIAFSIADIVRFSRCGDFLRPQVLCGHSNHLSSSLQNILSTFNAGIYNLLIVTKSAEYVDNMRSSVVIRFDMFGGELSYAFCRARLGQTSGHLIHMFERGNSTHRRLLIQISNMDPALRQWIGRLTGIPGTMRPPIELKENTDSSFMDSDAEVPAEFLLDPTTGRRIYEEDSMPVIYRFASRFALKDREMHVGQLFEFQEHPGGPINGTFHSCTVCLPPGSHVSKVAGPPCTSVLEAKRAACYIACQELMRVGLLDSTLFPRLLLKQDLRKAVPLPEEEKFGPTSTERSASKAHGVSKYLSKTPDFWDRILSASGLSGNLFPVVISASSVSGSAPDAVFAPIALLTRAPLPEISDINLFISGSPSRVRIIRGAPIAVDSNRLEMLHKYTTRLFRSVFNKALASPLQNTAYFVAPLTSCWTPSETLSCFTLPLIEEHISWDAICSAIENITVPLNDLSLESLKYNTQDAIIQDRRVEFTRRFYAVRVRPDLTPLSKAEDSPREAGYENFLSYCNARIRGFAGIQDTSQPLIEVNPVSPVCNHLNPALDIPPQGNKYYPAKYLIPELCSKLTIPASVFRTALLLPSILRRIDDILLVKELNAILFDQKILEDHLLAAVTVPSMAMEFDYERLELLGDAYLKYLSSIYSFVTEPASHEGALHILRQSIISNRSLFLSARNVDLPRFIQARSFTVKGWLPHNYVLATAANGLLLNNHAREHRAVSSPGKKKKSENIIKTSVSVPYQNLSDKSVADVVEAIIGAAYLSGGSELALQVTKALKVPLVNIDQWSDLGWKALATSAAGPFPLNSGSQSAIEAIIDYKFSKPQFLWQALSHPSTQNNKSMNYQRLEFIGDAVLDFLVVRHLFHRHKTLSPGALTLLKCAMVSNSALAAICVIAGLHRHLLYDSSELKNNIDTYEATLKTRKAREYETATRENRRPGQYWSDLEPPKVLSDIVESIFGAVFASDNFLPYGSEKFFERVLKPFYDQHITLQTLSHHPTKTLFELFQSQGCQEFAIMKETFTAGSAGVTCNVIVHEIILAASTEVSSTAAARAASVYALDALEGDAGFLSRVCDCRARNSRKRRMTIEEMEELTVETVLNST